VCFPENTNNNTPTPLKYILYPIGKWLRWNFTASRGHWVLKTLWQTRVGI
jgi:hypothetical protein